MVVERKESKVQLWGSKQGLLIIIDQAGVVYSNQTNGVACNHPQTRGYGLPVPPELTKKLIALGEEEPLGSFSIEEAAKLVDRYLPGWLVGLDSHEAWLCLQRSEEEEPDSKRQFDSDILSTRPGQKAVLTYPNSD
jgi:hypothetical protein